MRVTSRGLLAAFFLVLSAGVAQAAEQRRGESVSIARGETVGDDLYVFGRDVRIAGRIDGDLVVFGRAVEITGPVQGDLIIAAETARISGPVAGSIRAATRATELSGPVARDVLVATQTLEMTPDARVDGDLWAAGANLTVAGEVAGEVRAAAELFSVRGEIEGNVAARASRIVLGEDAHIGGVLKYRSPQEAELASGAQIDGDIVPEIVRRSPGAMVGWIVLTWLQTVVGLTILGLVGALVFPRFTNLAPSTVRAAPWKALGWGVVASLAIPLLILVLFVLGGIAGTWWLGLIALAAYFVMLALCFPIVGLFLGELILKRFGARGGKLAVALLTGIALLVLAGVVPVLGIVVVFATLWFGLGALLLTGNRLRREEGTPSAA